ncbi:chitin deacetylase 8-like [Epargyreus clarus]|uniref:chitin deacetylase 8-like n=1 Tax=Epargyreus clarus TaxID=520877 RepID=UPI003C2E78FB
MKWFVFVLSLCSLAIAREFQLAETCDKEACQLPDCRCSSTDIPGGLLPRNTPQFVVITFDDAITVSNINTYRDVLYNRRNSNGCPAGVTFYVNHEYTDYTLVNELYNQRFEIALHSISHKTSQTYWSRATYDDMMREFGDQRIQMAHFANIPFDTMRGVRIPFLQMTGNMSHQVMADVGLLYDGTWPTIKYADPGLWPYTLDYASIQDCMVPPCPTASIPKSWIKPMICWFDLNNVPCAMVDSCFHVPDGEDDEGWFRFILKNFERHYHGTRAPFGFYIHEWYLRANSGVKRALIRFLDLVNSLNDVFMVNSGEVIDWVRNPVPVNEYIRQGCKPFNPTSCPISTCGPLRATHNNMNYWMNICNVCPRVYPWLGNPLGQ